jgi:multiple sugar transport system substrate-binding protein
MMDTQDRAGGVRQGLDRRGFLRLTAGGVAGVAGILAGRQPPALAQQHALTMLSFNNFVPQSDEELRRQGQVFAKQAKVKVTIDTIDGSQLPQKLAAEVQTRAGHDVVALPRSSPYLYKDSLVSLDAMGESLGKKHSGWYDFCRDYSVVDGHWKALYWLWIDFPGQYNKRYFDEAGLHAPDTWEELLQAGRVLKKRGHPVGVAISQCFDANASFWSIMWGFGGKVLDADGKTIAMETPEMQTTLEFYKVLYTEAMDNEVLSWDNASNNRCLVSGRCCWIHNPISAYESARSYHMPIADDIYFHRTPAGPAGRYEEVGGAAVGIWNFSPNIELAKELLAFLFAPENYSAWITASFGYNHPALRDFADNPIWQKDPKTAELPKEAEYARASGWPAKPNQYVQLIENNYILPNMAAKVVTGTPITEAIHWGVEQVRKVFGS